MHVLRLTRRIGPQIIFGYSSIFQEPQEALNSPLRSQTPERRVQLHLAEQKKLSFLHVDVKERTKDPTSLAALTVLHSNQIGKTGGKWWARQDLNL
jgi:hypothetical protein